MRNILVVYGGESYEHDISILSAIQISGYLSGGDNRLIPCYIDRLGAAFIKPCDPLNTASYTGKRVRGKRLRFCHCGVCVGCRKINIDCAVICTHGGNGENGALSGMLEMYNIPYTCASPYACSVTMNKAKTHERLNKQGIQCVDYICLAHSKRAKNYEIRDMKSENLTKIDTNAIINSDLGDSLDEICGFIALEFGERLVVKPNNLGSSVGVKAVEGIAELKDALEQVFALDIEAIVERRVDNLVEYNCACLEFDGSLVVSGIERPLSLDKVLDFNAKYLASGKLSGLDREYPAKISDDLASRITAATAAAYKGLEMSGITRIDYLYDLASDELYLNEVNSIPGSLAYYLFPIKPYKLFNMAIDNAIARYNEYKLYQREYDSPVLNAAAHYSPKLHK